MLVAGNRCDAPSDLLRNPFDGQAPEQYPLVTGPLEALTEKREMRMRFDVEVVRRANLLVTLGVTTRDPAADTADSTVDFAT
ncbi:MAG TPA: hypothetical protein VJT49_25045 [Amycolatopsis sp.]|nr:hypothetical protein [Amycolatopsis sp.]HKS48316.1 hypothetical protein [Amycolatopsis sp.]